MIKLENIRFQINGINILKNVSTTVNRGDFITIVGSNGAGKSTLLDLIAGKISPTQGRITIDDQDVTTVDELGRTHLIARLFQNPRLNVVNSMSVSQNIALATLKGRRAKMRSAMSALPTEIIAHVMAPMLNGSTEQILSRNMGALSGGQRQTIALVMATLSNPKILLLDEPTAALDPQAATKLLTTTIELVKKHGITTLLITHDPYIATHVGNKLWIMENGTIKTEYGLEKRSLNTNNLVGEIDYKSLTQIGA